MRTGAQALFDGIIDYAGLFPPAQLPMDDAFARFLKHRAENDGWVLSRFVCPTARFAELEPLLTEIDPAEPLIGIAALGRGGATLDEFNGAVDQDAAAMRGLASRHEQRVIVDVFEVRLPESGGVAVAVENTWRSLGKGGSSAITPFFEVSLLDEWRPRLPAAAAAVRDTDRLAGGLNRVGLKIRCGGLDASAVPDPEAVAAAIATCRAIDVPIKATQGLHHPVRHHDPELDTMVHGFLNLFAASSMAFVHDLPVTRLTEIVAEEEAEAFVIDDHSLRWRDLEASAEQIAAARERLLTTFGSCSFQDPRNDLREIDLI
jgi:hypothetical protein